MKKKIISINEDLCIGCGNCVSSCKQNALQIVDGKARLVKEDFCDGFGNCIGKCPTDALTIIEKEIETKDVTQCSCPSSIVIDRKKNNAPRPTQTNLSEQRSELKQWPVQLHLVNPSASYFKDSELVVLSTCSPVASAEIHSRFIKDRAVVVACPKLDRTEGYIEKLKDIFVESGTPKVTVVIMNVPCCKGLSVLVSDAVKLSGRKDLELEEFIIDLDGRFLEGKRLSV
jgi:NAD-dependent dihydropyrimidine dehydrogenase PreA subunit